MSFSRAAVKRFNDDMPSAANPAPADYDPKSLGPKGTGIALQRSSRFSTHKEFTPGPGQYDVSAVSTVKKGSIVNSSRVKRSSSLCVSRKGIVSNSTGNVSAATSENTDDSENEVFLTPCPLLKSVRRTFNWQERCKELEARIRVLEAELSEAASSKSKITELEGALERTKGDLAGQKSALEGKLSSLEAAVADRNDLEKRLGSTIEEKEANDIRIATLKEELDLMTQDNRTLEEGAVVERDKLEAEKKELEGRANFLLFTQEQLRSQIDENEQLMKRLEEETAALKEEVAQLHADLSTEREKLDDVMAAYSRENEEAMTEFVELRSEKEALMAERDALLEKVAEGSLEIERLTDYTATLDGRLGDLDEKVQSLEERKETLEVDLECAENDKCAVEEELVRAEKSVRDLELDLASVSREKEMAETRVGHLERDLVEAEVIAQELELARKKVAGMRVSIDEITDANVELQRQCQDLGQRLEAERVEFTAMLEAAEKERQELEHDARELDMKSSSLQGALHAANGELTAITSEKDILVKHLDKCQESLESEMALNTTMSKELETLRDMKKDLNETCLISEDRMVAAEKAYSALRNKHETDTEAHGKQVSDLEAALASEREAKSELERQSTAMEESKARLQNEAASSEAKCRGLAAAAADAEARLESMASERRTLLEMNEDLSVAAQEHLGTISRLQEREQDLAKRGDMLAEALEKANSGMESEVQFHWAAEDEVLGLKDELDRLQLEAVEKERSALKCGREADQRLAAAEAERDNAGNALEVVAQELREKDVLIVKLMRSFEENEKEARALRQRMAGRDELAAEKEAVQREFEEAKEGLIKLDKKYSEAVELIGSYVAEADEMKEQQEVMQLAAADREVEIGDLRGKLQEKEKEEEGGYKDKYETLYAMVEPFRDQLEAYEVEKTTLESQNKARESDLKQLATQYGQLLGHQNHNQKIKHMVKLKEENVTLKTRVAALETDLAKARRKLTRPTFNKENASMLMPVTPMASALKTPLGSALRSKSPLGSINRNASVRK